MALQAIKSKKARSFLTMLGIIIGVCAVLVLLALVSGYNADITEYYEKLGVNKVNLSIASYYDTIDITSDLYEYANGELSDMVTGVTPNISASATLKYLSDTNSTAKVYLGSDQFSVCNNYTLKKGRDISFFDIENRHRVCIIGAYVAEQLFQYADPIEKTLYINGTPYTIVGIYYKKDGSTESSMDDMVVVPYSMNRELLGTSKISKYIVKVDVSDNVSSVISELETYLDEKISSKGTYTLEDGNTELSGSNEETASLSVVLGGIAGIALLVGGIGIMNIMLVTVTERTREIGIKKAIGADRSVIITQFLVESAVLSALGGVLGIILGYLLSLILGKAIYDLILLPDVWVAAGAFLFSVAIGIGFGIYPAIKASSLQPVDALRAD